MPPSLSLCRDSSRQYTNHFQLGSGHLLLPLGHACETTEPQVCLGQKRPLSLSAACQGAHGQALAETDIKQKPQAMLGYSQTMAELGMDLDTAIMAVKTVRAQSDTDHVGLCQRSW